MKYLISIILSCTILFSEISNLGSGAAYIYGTNAREFSMGNTLSSVNNYGYNAFSNPALLTNVKDLEFGVSLFAAVLRLFWACFGTVLGLFGGCLEAVLEALKAF